MLTNKNYADVSKKLASRPFSFRDQSPESEFVEGVTLDNQISGRAEKVRNSEPREDIPRNLRKGRKIDTMVIITLLFQKRNDHVSSTNHVP